MTALTVVSTACRLLSIPTISGADFDAGTALAAAKMRVFLVEAAKIIASRHNWQSMIRETTFTTVAQAEQTSSVPTDFDRMIPETMFDRTANRRVLGPVSPTQWQEIQSSIAASANPVFRLRRSAAGTTPLIIAMAPTPSAGHTIAYEYVSSYFAHNSGTAIADTAIVQGSLFYFDERILARAIVVQFKEDAGLDAGADQTFLEQLIRNAILRDGSRARLSTDPPYKDRVPMAPIVPETYILP